MVNYEIDAEDVITDFLRARLTDTRSRAEATSSSSTTATAGQTNVTITSPSGTVSAITSVTVNAATMSKWKDYFWDYQSQKITFYTALTVGDAIVVNYKYGTTNWAYSDRPDENLSATSFPRISIFTVSSPGNRLGQYTAPVESSHMLQIDIWVKEDYVATISSRTYEGEYLARYIGNQILRAFEEYESDLFPVLYNYTPLTGPKAAPYSDRYQAFHAIVEIQVKGLRSGRISK